MQDNNYAKVKSNKWASDDDAADLLSGILSETEDEALAEQQRLENELRAKQEAERLEVEAEEQRKRAEAEAKLSAEMNRLQQVAERRTAKIEALKIEELKERGEWIDPEVERAKLEAERQKQIESEKIRIEAEMQAKASVESATRLPSPTPQKKSSAGLFVIAAFLVLAAVGTAIGVVLMSQYKVDNTSYAKAVHQPTSNKIAMVEKGFTPIPKAAPAVENAVAADSKSSAKSSKRKKTRKSTSRASSSKSKPKKSNAITGKPKKNKASKKLDDLLNSGDIFGGGP